MIEDENHKAAIEILNQLMTAKRQKVRLEAEKDDEIKALKAGPMPSGSTLVILDNQIDGVVDRYIEKLDKLEKEIEECWTLLEAGYDKKIVFVEKLRMESTTPRS